MNSKPKNSNIIIKEMIVSHEKISQFEELLNSSNFLRLYKSFIVAIDKIKFKRATVFS